jgi:capsular exopolysaccharide synthesis family protein
LIEFENWGPKHMSRNFELLQKLGREQELIKPVQSPDEAPRPVPVPSANTAAAAPAIAPISAPLVTAARLPKQSLEQINGLAQQVFLSQGADAPRVVTLAATEPGSGCTWVSGHLAEVLASRVAGSVCLIDANLRDPGLHRLFEVENTVGMSDALIHPEPIRGFVRQLTLANLWFIAAGLCADAAQPLLTSDRMRMRIAELRSEFDFILIDASALNVSNDALGLGALSDGVLMVLKANTSRRETARQAMQELQGANAKVLGAVLNQRTFPIPEAIYKRF